MRSATGPGGLPGRLHVGWSGGPWETSSAPPAQEVAAELVELVELGGPAW